jgi:diacylglycerol O-acyltransferase
VARRLHLVPRFRQIVIEPGFGLGTPLWADAQTFDIQNHVRLLPGPAPADVGQLLEVWEKIRRSGLDKSRPLWEIWLLPPQDDGRVGMVVKLHHCVADGIAGVATIGSLFDLEPDRPRFDSPTWTPAPLPTNLELFADALRRRIAGGERKLSALSHPIDSLRKLAPYRTIAREFYGEEPAPATSLNFVPGLDRRLSILRGSLDEYKNLARAGNAKVNDVLLTAVAGGLRELLLSRGEEVDDVSLRASVPVSMRESEDQPQDNVTSGMAVPLPIGEPDHLRRLALIAADTRERKKQPRATPAAMMRTKLAFRVWLHYFRRQKAVNLFVTNVPGPPMPLYFAGARTLEIFPAIPLGGNLTLGVGALSYAGQFNVTAVADRELCPDVDIFVEGLGKALKEMKAAVRKEAA